MIIPLLIIIIVLLASSLVLSYRQRSVQRREKEGTSDLSSYVFLFVLASFIGTVVVTVTLYFMD